jgi:PAS domain S-box-containing protein
MESETTETEKYGCSELQIWEATFDAVPALICIIDTSHTIVRANLAMAQYCGMAREELPGRKCHTVMHGSGTPVESCPHTAAIRGGAPHSMQVKEGERTLEVTVSPIRNTRGEVTGYVHVARETTAAVTAEAFARMEQEILRILNEAGSNLNGMQRILSLVRERTGVDAVGIRLEDGDDFPYFCQEGFPADFLLRENSLLARRQDGGVCRDECGNISLECNCGVVLCGKTDPSKEHFTPGGSLWTNDSAPFLHIPEEEDPRTHPRNQCVHEGYASVALVPIRAKGRTVGLVQLNARSKGAFTLDMIGTLENVCKNIGEAMLRRQAEEKLVASEAFLRTLTDELPGPAGYWTSDYRCTFSNRAYLNWFGKNPDEADGLSLREFLGEDHFNRNLPYLQGVFRGEPQSFEAVLPTPEGGHRHTWCNYIPDMADGKARGFFVVASDITAVKKAEEEKLHLEAQLLQTQKMESIGRLAGGVAHDFNNMLSVILGHAELALGKMERGKSARHHLEAICSVAERSANLTRQLLGFARKQHISPKVVDLNESVSTTLDMLRRLLGEDVRLFWQPASRLWKVKMDTSQLDQILANLCLNARDAIADTGRITITTANSSIDEEYCASHPDATPGDYVRLTVADDGCGIGKEILDKIFEPFFTTKEIGQGTGLGLATVFGIVKQNNGLIEVSSEPAKGSTFSVYLPRHLSAEGATPADGEERGESPLPVARGTILLVEDEPMILEVAADMLEAQGYRVLQAGTPEQAIELAEHYPEEVDLLLTDVIMPSMNGRELAKKLATANPRLKCLFMSGYTADIIACRGVDDGDFFFLQKPFSLQSLTDKVRYALSTPEER